VIKNTRGWKGTWIGGVDEQESVQQGSAHKHQKCITMRRQHATTTHNNEVPTSNKSAKNEVLMSNNHTQQKKCR